MTANLAFDYGPEVRINAVAPGAIRTDALASVLTPERRHDYRPTCSTVVAHSSNESNRICDAKRDTKRKSVVLGVSPMNNFCKKLVL